MQFSLLCFPQDNIFKFISLVADLSYFISMIKSLGNYIYIYIYICVCVCVCVYIYVYTHIDVIPLMKQSQRCEMSTKPVDCNSVTSVYY